MTLSRRAFIGRTAGAYVAVATANGRAINHDNFISKPMGPTLQIGLMQGQKEASYEGYARVNIERNEKAWSISRGHAETVHPVNFPECKSGSNTITGFTVYDSEGRDLFTGDIDPNIYIAAGVSLQLSNISITL